MTKEEIIEAVKEMTVLELNELVEAIEEEFGVTAAAPVAVAGGAAGGEAEEEKTEFDVVLLNPRLTCSRESVDRTRMFIRLPSCRHTALRLMVRPGLT